MNKQINSLVVGLFLTSLLVGCAAPTATTVPTQAPQPTTAAVQPTQAPTALPTEATEATSVATTNVAPTQVPTALNVPTLPATNATPTSIANLPTTADDLQVVSPQELKAMMDGGADIVIADAQPAEGYAKGHVKGAVNLPWASPITGAGGLPMDKLVILYCACDPSEKPSGTDAGDVAMQLITKFGYTKIAVLDGGWLRWQQLGYPTGD